MIRLTVDFKFWHVCFVFVGGVWRGIWRRHGLRSLRLNASKQPISDAVAFWPISDLAGSTNERLACCSTNGRAAFVIYTKRHAMMMIKAFWRTCVDKGSMRFVFMCERLRSGKRSFMIIWKGKFKSGVFIHPYGQSVWCPVLIKAYGIETEWYLFVILHKSTQIKRKKTHICVFVCSLR